MEILSCFRRTSGHGLSLHDVHSGHGRGITEACEDRDHGSSMQAIGASLASRGLQGVPLGVAGLSHPSVSLCISDTATYIRTRATPLIRRADLSAHGVGAYHACLRAGTGTPRPTQPRVGFAFRHSPGAGALILPARWRPACPAPSAGSSWALPGANPWNRVAGVPLERESEAVVPDRRLHALVGLGHCGLRQAHDGEIGQPTHHFLSRT